MNKEVWIFAENDMDQMKDSTLEILSEGRKLAHKLNRQICVCIIGYQVKKFIYNISNYGVKKVYLVENALLYEYSIDGHAFALATLIKKYRPAIIMISATPIGSELAPRVAARLKLPCITEVKKIAVNGDNLAISKSGYSDRVYFNYNFTPKRSLILTILPGDMEIEEEDKSEVLEIVREDIHIEPNMIRTRSIEFIKGDPKKIDIKEAELIVAGGKGIGSKKELPNLEELADLLGASVGGTRPLVDQDIIPFERQIGITGKSVSPKLLLACGISGAREFTAGIEKTQITIAVNSDARAPIFNIADLGVLGDVHEIIPALIKRLKKREKTEKADEVAND